MFLFGVNRVKNFFLSSLLILSFLSTFGVSQDAKSRQITPLKIAQPGIELPFVSKTLPNGLEVIVLQDSSVPIVTVEIAVRNGSFTEPPELNGLSHLYEHMFFKTNEARFVYQCETALNSGRITAYGRQICSEKMKFKSQVGDVSYFRRLSEFGLPSPNGTTQEEYVNYYYNTLSVNLAPVMRIMRDSMLYPSFDENELSEEIQVVLGELDRNLSNPYYYLDRTLMDKLFYKFPSRKSPGGTRETVAKATTEQMRLIQSRYYVPNNSALIVTGDADPQKVFALAADLFGVWQKAEDPFKKFPIVDHPPLAKSEGVIVNQDVENVIVQIGWHGPSTGKDDASTYAADIFSFILRQPNSRFQRALIDSGLAVDAGIHYYTQRNVGPIRITLVSSPEKAKAALDAVYKEIAQFANPNYFTDEELLNAKNLIEAENLYRREKLSEYTHELGFWWSSTGIDYYRGYYKNLRAITRDDVKRYVTTYIQGKPHVGVALVSAAEQQKAKLTESDLIGK